MVDLEAVVLVGLARRRERAGEHPVVLGHEGVALALLLDHDGERGRLDAARAADVAEAAEAGHREVAREDGAPDEVDVLA